MRTETRLVLQQVITGLLGITRPTTHFEHSLGAFILVRRLDAALDEQIAALLHDASHTAFSHVHALRYEGIDYHGHDSQSYLAGSGSPGFSRDAVCLG